MEHVLTTPELLHIIFSFATEGSKACSARVCREWSDIALSLLWAHVSGEDRLFSLLAPINGRPFEFERDITDDDWDVFDRYAPFIKRLTLDGTSDEFLPLYESVARTRTRLVLLPNLKYLRMNCDMIGTSYSLMFLHNGLLRITITGFDEDEEERMCLNLIRRATNITDLRLDLSQCANHSEDNFIKLFKGLRSLRKVWIPKFFLTAPVMSILSELPNLEEIRMALYDSEDGDSLMRGVSSDLRVFKPDLAEEAFPKLRRLEIASLLKDATHLFSKSLGTSSNITSLYMNTHWTRRAMDYTQFFHHLSSSCPSLEYLHIVMEDWEGFVKHFELDKITMDTFRPLLKLGNMRSFGFHFPKSIALVDNDMAQFGLSWRNLESLSFNAELSTKYTPNLTLAALEILAAHCPNLEFLQIYIDATNRVMRHRPSSKFNRIKKFDFGKSPLKCPDEVAKYISHLCTECHDIPRITMHHYPVLERYRWEDVIRMVDLILRTFKDEKTASSHSL